MVTVAEKTPARGRFEQLRQALEERRTALADARAEVARLERAEQEARAQALAEKPKERAYKRGEPAFEYRARRERAESSIPGLEDEVCELDRLVEAAVEGAARELVDQRITEIGQFTADSFAAWQIFCERFAALFAAWCDVLEATERADGAATELLGEELVELAPCLRRDIERAARLPIVPMPTGFGVAVDVLYRVAFSLDMRKAPVNERLAELVPDLRGLVRAPRLSGRVDTISSTAPPERRRL